MKIYIQIAALASALLFVVTSAAAHPGHTLEISEGHNHAAEYAVIGVFAAALLIIFLTALWKRGR
ncbi:MAG: hypothetical protein AAFR90_04025 [Pseudomonadota bacterium]